RWVLVPEMARCFVPLTFFWWVTLFGDSGLIRLDADVVQRNFIGVPGGVAVLAALTFSGVLGVLGPIGLLAALRLIALSRSIRSSVLAGALVAGPLVLGVIYVATLGARTGMLEAAGGLLLLFVLPAIGAAHLYHLGLRSADGRPDD